MGIMLDSIRYRLYAVESETSEPSGTMSRIRLEDHAGNITYGLDAGTWPPDEYDRWLDEHWDDPAEVKAIQYRANAIVDPAHLPDRWIQACVWTIVPHDVVDIRPACGKPDTMVSHG